MSEGRFVQKISDSLVVVSDIHLRESEDSRAKLLLELISRLHCENVEYFVLLGDIFDFCFGATSYFQRKYAPIGEALMGLVQKGVKVIFVQGNHEFSLDCMPWEGVRFISQGETAITLSNGKKFCFTHGDTLVKTWHYSLYYRLVRSKIFKWAGQCCPQKLLDNFCLRVSQKSREKSANKKINHNNILDKASEWLKSVESEYGIFGHFHVPYFYRGKDSKERILASLASWDKPNALSYAEGKFYRYLLHDPKADFEKMLLK